IALSWVAILVAASTAAPQPYQRIDVWRDAVGFVVPMLSTYLLPAVWWFLIAQVFHSEAMPGDRQFWLTRPSRRASLFGAKALFVLAYVTLPLTVAQGAILVLRGFPLTPYL